MAKKKQTKWWYVIVLTGEGPRFVTDVQYTPKVAKWDKTEKPYEMGEAWAHDLVMGLMWNGYSAYPVCTQFPIETQPYDYREGHFEWVWKRG